MTAAYGLIGLAVLLAALMAGAWFVVVRTGKSGLADSIWSLSTGLACIVAALLPLDGAAPGARGWLVAALIAVWSLRLGLHLRRRALTGADDPRYAQLKRDWGSRWRRQLFLFLEIQAGAAWILALATLVAVHRLGPLGIADAIGGLIAVVAIIGEAVADRQLAAFKANPANRGRVCDQGLWSLSRHPNYFFEWLYWLALVPIGFSLDYAWGWLALLAPIQMYVLLRHVSGVPPLEAHMLRTKPEAFAAYQRRVSAFWPIRGVAS